MVEVLSLFSSESICFADMWLHEDQVQKCTAFPSLLGAGVVQESCITLTLLNWFYTPVLAALRVESDTNQSQKYIQLYRHYRGQKWYENDIPP